MAKTRPADVPLPDPRETFLTREEAARLARIGVSTFDREVARGRIQVSRIGRRVTVLRQEIERYMMANRGPLRY